MLVPQGQSQPRTMCFSSSGEVRMHIYIPFTIQTCFQPARNGPSAIPAHVWHIHRRTKPLTGLDNAAVDPAI